MKIRLFLCTILFSQIVWGNQPELTFQPNPVSRLHVVLIQDIHMNLEAQNQISRLLQSLIDEGRLARVGIEGAFTELNFSFFRFAKNKSLLAKVAKNIFDQNGLA